jgi:hypothetical protein
MGLPYLGTHQVARHSYAITLDNAGWSAKAIADVGGRKSPCWCRTPMFTPVARRKGSGPVWRKTGKPKAKIRKNITKAMYCKTYVFP